MIKRIYILMLTVLLCVPFVQAGKLAPGDVFTVETSSDQLTRGLLIWTYEVNEDGNSVTLSKVKWSDATAGFLLPQDISLVINDVAKYEGTEFEVTGIKYLGNLTLDSLVLPYSIKEYEPDAFRDIECKKFVVSGEGGALTSHNGILMSSDERLLIRYPILAEIYPPVPDTVKEFARSAYQDCKYPLPVPDGVEEIPDYLFYRGRCALPLPTTLKKIGKKAFAWCMNLSFRVPEGVSEIEDEAFVCEYTFDEDKRISPILKSVYMPSTVKSIGNGVFDVHSYETTGIQTPWIVLKDVNVPFSPLTTSQILKEEMGTYRFVILESVDNLFTEKCEAYYDEDSRHKDYYLSHTQIKPVSVIPDGDIVFSEWQDGKCTASFVSEGETLPIDGWLTEDPDIAYISSKGVIIAKKSGVTNVYCSFADKTIYYGRFLEISPDNVAVNEIEEDSYLPDMIWDLSGRPVYGELNAQQPGIYIVRKNGKTTKQVVGRR